MHIQRQMNGKSNFYENGSRKCWKVAATSYIYIADSGGSATVKNRVRDSESLRIHSRFRDSLEIQQDLLKITEIQRFT